MRKPGAALIETLASELDSGLSVDRRASVSPFHRDLRFAAAGSPRYKDHVLLTTWQGEDKKTAPTIWIRIDATSVGFASGVAFSPAVRERWREAVAGRAGVALADELASLTQQHRGHEAEIAGERLHRTPRPWDDTHPRRDLLRLKGFQFRFREPLPKLVDSPRFAAWCAARLRPLMPIHAWLVRELGTNGARR